MGLIVRLLLVLWVLSGCSDKPVSGEITNGPEQIAETFYRALRANPLVDLPAPEQYRVFRPLLQQSLLRRLEQAYVVDRQIHANEPQPTPPLSEGSLFTSLFEGVTDFELIGCQTKKLTSRCQFKLIYDNQGKRVEWQDGLRLRQGRLGWQVEDVDYGGDWDFAPQGTLTSRLDTIIAMVPAPTDKLEK
jgi:hypothetical protein